MQEELTAQQLPLLRNQLYEGMFVVPGVKKRNKPTDVDF